MTQLQERLFDLQDFAYRAFQQKLIPTIDPETIIGVRVPALRKLAGEGLPEEFLNRLPHRYLEENMLHGFAVSRMRDFSCVIAELDRFLPYVDNWAVCDGIRPACFAGHRLELVPGLARWLHDAHPYTVRFAMEMLMVHYLDDCFDPIYPEWVSKVVSNNYYVNMMIAWYFATALAKQYDNVVPYLENHVLSPWIHRKTIQKAIESYRITPEQKQILRTLR